MSEQLNNYLNEMNKSYEITTLKIKESHDKDPSRTFSDLLTEHNEGIKDFIVHLISGTGLHNLEDNRAALEALKDRHYKFMDFVLSI